MATQRLTASRRTAICIETPAGLIRITSMGGKKLEIVLPEGMTANIGEDRSFATAKWIERRSDDGKTLAKFRILTPVLAPDGSLIGLDAPTVRRLAL